MTFSIKWSSGIILGLFLVLGALPTYARAEILYVSFDSSSATSTGLGPNAGNNPKYRIVGSFVAGHDINFNDATSSIVFEGTNSTPGVSFNVDFSTSTDSLYPSPPGVFNSFWPGTYSSVASDGLPHQYTINRDPNTLGPTAAIVHTGETVYVLIYSTQGFPFATQSITTDTPQTSFFGEITFNESPPVFTVPTKIINPVPLAGQIVATSTAGTIGAKLSVNTQQMTNALAQNAGNWFINITLTKPVNTSCGFFCFGAAGTNIKNITIPTNNQTGTFTLSTTTDLTTVGNYKMTIQLVQPSWASTYLSWFGFSGTVLDSTTTTFTVSNLTGLDHLSASSTSIIDQFLASTTPELIASCASFTSFQLADCLNLLFIPQASTFSYILADVQGILAFAPWGYATRAIAILSGSATSTLPLIAVGIPDPSNIHQYMMFHFDPNEAIAGAATLNDGIVDPVSEQPVMPGIRQIVDTVIGLSVITYIFYDLIGGSKNANIHKTKLS